MSDKRMATRTVSVHGANGQITVGQLKAFIMGAEKMGISDDAVVKATVTFGGKLKSLEAAE